VWIGRDRDCDVVGDDPHLSRRHALVRVTQTSAEILPLGRQAVKVNGKDYDRPQELHHGDKIELPGLELSVELSTSGNDPEPMFRLTRDQGGSFGVTHSPFVVGGDSSDDLIIKKWPAHALTLHIAQGELFVDVAKGKALRNGDPIPTKTLEPLMPGDHLEYRNERFMISQTALDVPPTQVTERTELPTRVSIEVLPRGGRVVFTLKGGEHAVFLHDRRLDLIVALLKPPEGYRAGDYIPDEVVTSIVWPRKAGASREDINVLIARCRRDLVEAGLAGPRLVQRAPTGGATRFALAPNAEITSR